MKCEFGPVSRWLGARYFDGVRFAPEAEEELRGLSERGFVVHVMRSTAWINFLYLAWAMVRRGLPAVRAVVNLRPWFTRPFVRTAQRGDYDVRFTYARRQSGSGLIFLKKTALLTPEGKDITENPFPALVAMARRTDTAVFLVPELFVWEKRTSRLKPSLMDMVFGSPEAPGFVHSMVAFFRNYKRAQFRVGEPIDLQRFIRENPSDSDELIARKVRSALHHHLSRETRAVFGPPAKSTDRLIRETLRDRVLRESLEEVAKASGRRMESVEREAKRDLEAIAARPGPTALAIASPILDWVFSRIYDGIDVDERGLERALRAARGAPVVVCPSHKSHVDYLILAWVLFKRGYKPPLVAAGANLSFWPLGPFLRRAGAFFLRRSFKDDKVYAAAFRAYIKKLIHDGIHQEFFPEGGRSRTGKLLQPRLGMFSWQVDALLERANSDIIYVPVSIDYEKVVESSSYSKELAGGEKKPEDLKALLTAPKVLTARYGRIHLTFDEPVSLVELMKARGLSLDAGVDEEQKKGLVRALSNRVMYGIGKVSTVTPNALVSAALLAGSHRGTGMRRAQVGDRIRTLRRIAGEEGAPLSHILRNSPSDPEALGAIQEAGRSFASDGLIRTREVEGELLYEPVPERRPELAFYKNTLMNLLAPRSLVAHAVLAGAPASQAQVKERALFLSRLFKLEFMYRVGASFDILFTEAVEALVRMGLVLRTDDALAIAPEAHALPDLDFLAELLRDYLEAYLLAYQMLEEVAAGTVTERKGFVRAALDAGRAALQSGKLLAPEALSKPTLENALAYLLDQRLLVEEDKKLRLGPAAQDAAARAQRRAEIARFLERG
nr:MULTISPECIES: 1-acyl-sn-glycerol-3-phosphate acyltransferase [Myxococcaceae]